MNQYERMWKTLKISLYSMQILTPQLADAFKIVLDVMEQGEKMAFGDKGDNLNERD